MTQNLVVAPILALALTSTAVASSNPTALQSRPPRLDITAQAALLEKDENFAGAIDLLQQHYSELDQSEREHLAHLRAFVAIHESNVDDHLLASDRSKSLEELLAKFDPVNDVYLLYEGRKELDDLDTRAVSIRGSRLGQFWSRVKASSKNGDVWSFPVSTLWVLIAPGLFVLLLIYVFWRFWPRKGFLISFEDLTVDGSSKPYKDRVLTQEVQEAFGVPRIDYTFGGVDLRVFAINDHDGSSFATLIPNNPLVVWSDIIQASSPIKVGPVEFNLKQLVTLILGFFRSPTRHALVGSLHDSEGQTVVSAQRLNRSRRLVAGFSWRAQSESTLHPHRDLIGDLTAQMLVDLLEELPTKSWRSYRNLLQGIEVFERRPPASDSCNCFDIARQHLWSSLEEDPMNWMARFYLAIALRRCNANEEAAQHLAAVAQLFATTEKRLARRLFHRLGSVSFFRRRRLAQRLVSRSFLERHLWKYPQCDLIVLYNRAMALSKLHNHEAMEDALNLLSLIVDLCDGRKVAAEAAGDFKDIPDVDAFSNLVPRLTKVDRQRFRRIAQSTQTVVWAAQAEYLCPGEVSPLHEVLDRIKHVESQIQGSASAADRAGVGSRREDSEIDLALATVCCAKGKAQTMLHQTDEARASFDRAILLAPNLVDAQLSLAASYVNDHGDDTSWIRVAEGALQKALKFDPNCPKAHYWLARLEYSRRPPNYDQALNYLARTEDLSEGLFLKAEIYASATFGGRNLDASINAWRDGLEGLPSVISSDVFYHLQRLKLIAEQNPKNCELQSVAQQAADHIDKNCPWQAGKWRSQAGDDHASAAKQEKLATATARV